MIVGLQESTGSGFIIASTKRLATIVTNAHVVQESNAQEVVVTLSDGRTFDGHVVSVDLVSDLCVLEVPTDEILPCAKLGSSKELRMGEFVVAVGSPLSLQNSVSMGIVSNARRAVKDLGMRALEPKLEYIQVSWCVQNH